MAASSLSVSSNDTVTTMPFNEIDLSQREAWDDTELIKAYDRAIATYQGVHGHIGEGTRSCNEKVDEELMQTMRFGIASETAGKVQLAQRTAAAAWARTATDAETNVEMQAADLAEAKAETESLFSACMRTTDGAEPFVASSFAVTAVDFNVQPRQAPDVAIVLPAAPETSVGSSRAVAAETERLLAWEQYYENCGWTTGPVGWQPVASKELHQRAPARWPNADLHQETASMHATHVPVAAASASTADQSAVAHKAALSNLVLAWYHCGYFTAKYQGQYM